MSTHGIGRMGPGSQILNDEVQIGSNITLPAGGPWLIYNMWSQSILTNSNGYRSVNGYIHLDSISGDITPDPAPGKFPLIPHFMTTSAWGYTDFDVINIFKTRLLAPGKSVIALSHISKVTIPDAPAISVGILFDKQVPIKRYSPWTDYVAADLSSNVETYIGTITMSEAAKRLTSIYCEVFPVDSITADDYVLATFRLDSDDIEITPAIFPSFAAWALFTGGNQSYAQARHIEPIHLNIPVLGGARINVFATLANATTSNVLAACHLTYE